ncbi:MAG: glycosyltransferase family 2 protein [Lachnospiraceae bacterium]|nr:glycosyltransferase family 2 protein [Lachnospiraceae bacterium]
MCKKIAAGIVTYNPDCARLAENLDAVCGQVDRVFLVDNGSVKVSQIREMLRHYPNCELHCNAGNEGLAKALNQIMQLAKEQGYSWVLTLDEDSVCESGMVGKLASALKTEEKHSPANIENTDAKARTEICAEKADALHERAEIGIICPRAIDDRMKERRESERPEFSERPERIQDCITAGSLTSVRAWGAAGGFDEKMFIDFVDVEFCTRLRTAGYEILRVPDALIHQQYGRIRGSFHLFGKEFYLFDYSPTRVYYSVRNQIYYMRKHRAHIQLEKQIFFLLGYTGKRIVFERRKRESVQMIVRGIRDGIKMQI